MNKTNVLMIENAQIIFRNFSGNDTKYSKGRRTFCVILQDEEQIQKLIDEGWNVRTLRPRDEFEEPKHYIQVSVSFDHMPPKIFLIAGRSKTQLDEDSIDSLDYADIASADLVIRPYNWTVNGDTGIKAYLKTAYIMLEEDDFASKYEEMF